MLIVEHVGPLVTVQDRGRRGFAHQGVPPSGPLDVETFEAAIAAVRGSDEAAIEIPLGSARFRFEVEAVVSIDGEPARTIAAGSVLEVAPHARAVRYLAVRGGIDVPKVLGSRATLVVAGIGGHEGRMLRRGDRLAIGAVRIAQPPRGANAIDDRDAPIPLLPVHDADPALLDAFVAATFRVSPRSDRVGTRLDPERPLPAGDERLSRPVAPGAVQVPPDGRPIVLGPDGPTTGGYPLVGVLPRTSRARLARLRPGAVVRFAIG